VLDGELIVREGRLRHLYRLAGCISARPTHRRERVQFAVFDVLSLDG
jgi:hypothetical protein